MKTLKLLTLIVVAAAIIIVMPATVLAGGHGHGHGHGHSSVSFGIGFGYYGWPGYYPYYYPYYSYPYYYPYYSYYYPGVVYVDPYYPPAVAAAPVVVQQPAVANPNPQYNYSAPVDNDFANIRQRKAMLLNQLNNGQKAERLQAISELAGFSFDDSVRKALEDVLVSDPDASLRKEAADSFGKVKNQGALHTLEKVKIADLDAEVRQAADNAINKIKS